MLSNGPDAAKRGQTDILIAGGGFVGLSLALALAQNAPQGFGIALVDAGPLSGAGPADARASALSAASRNLLDALGVWAGIAHLAEPMRKIEITDSPLAAEDRRPRYLAFDGELRPGEPGAYVIENAPLLKALAAAVASEPAIEVIAPDRVEDFDSGPHGVAVALKSGGMRTARLLVAADGRNSRLRAKAGIKTVGWTYPQMGIVATIAHAKPHHGKAVQHFLPAGPFALLPLTGNRTSIVWSEDKDEAVRIMALDDEGFLAELAKRFGDRLGAISLAGPRQAFPLALHIARDFAAPRLALIGDAAHGVHPLAGQGLNIGLRDVAALSELIVETVRLGLDPGDRVMLERYERWRRFDSTVSALAMDLMNRLFSNDNAALRAIRDLGLAAVDKAPALKRFFVSEAAGRTGRLPKLLQGRRL